MKTYVVTGFNGVEKLFDSVGVRITGPEEMRVSDGYHTMDELYEHRIQLFIELCRYVGWMSEERHDLAPNEVWRSKFHADGSSYEGWFILGIGVEKGKQITYHLPMTRWSETDFAESLKTAPEFDGHTSQDVLARLKTL